MNYVEKEKPTIVSIQTNTPGAFLTSIETPSINTVVQHIPSGIEFKATVPNILSIREQMELGTRLIGAGQSMGLLLALTYPTAGTAVHT